MDYYDGSWRVPLSQDLFLPIKIRHLLMHFPFLCYWHVTWVLIQRRTWN